MKKYVFVLLACSAPVADPVPEWTDVEPLAEVELGCSHEPKQSVPWRGAPEAFTLVERPSVVEREVRSLRLRVDDERLLPYVEVVASEYKERLGLSIVVAPDGIPVGVAPEVPFKGKLYDGLARYERICAFDECNSEHNVSIVIAEVMLGAKEWAMEATMRHEIGHVVSGWGSALGVDMHAPDDGHVMSAAACRGGICGTWQSLDYEMMCAGAPCKFWRWL